MPQNSSNSNKFNSSFDVLAVAKFLFQNAGGMKRKITGMVLKKAMPYLLIAILVIAGLNALFTYLFVQVFT